MAPSSLLKKGQEVGRGHKGYGTTIMLVADAKGRPIAVQIACASRHESVLVESTLAGRFVKKLPVHLIGDKAYDSDPLDEKLQRLGIEMIAPHRRNRVYREAWKIKT